MEAMININEIIEDMFNLYWKGEYTLSSIDNMRKQLSHLQIPANNQ